MEPSRLPDDTQRHNACRARREIFGRELSGLGLSAALLVEPVHLAYFFGLWGWRQNRPAAGLVTADGQGILAVGASVDCVCFADELIRFEDAKLATVVEYRPQLALGQLRQRFPVFFGSPRLGTDLPRISSEDGNPLVEAITHMRRAKQADEVALIRNAIAATEAGYRAIAPILRAGLTEIELYAAFHSAVTVAAGIPVGELGHDFRGGAPAGRPRPVPLVAGDLIPVDAGIALYGYHSDLCRTFAVSGQRNAAQEAAFKRVSQSLDLAESMIAPGVSCAKVFAEISDFLTRGNTWRFGHHLGHGIGLEGVETPRINPNWDDCFQEGDTFTLEPGLYGDDLNGGIRTEQNYLILNGKLQLLSSLPHDVRPA